MTIRLAFVADSQVDERSRLEEHDRVMYHVARDAGFRGCAALIHVGDVFERRSTERERAAVREWISTATLNGVDVYIVGGNHEALGEVAELSLTTAARRATESPAAWFCSAGANGPFEILALPWPRRERLLAWIGEAASPLEADNTARDLLRNVIRGLSPVRDAHGGPRILAAHVMVDGSNLGPDQPPVGEGMRVGLDDLALAEADLIVLGHVHRPQEWTITRADGVVVPVIYCGSPGRTAYAKGELEPKGYVVAEFEGRRLVKWERVPTPATPLVLVEAEFDPRGVLFRTLDGAPWPSVLPVGAEARFRYEVASDQREVARVRAEQIREGWISDGAAEVVLEEVVAPTSSARCPEVALARTYADKLDAMWRSRGETISDERHARLLARLEELER